MRRVAFLSATTWASCPRIRTPSHCRRSAPTVRTRMTASTAALCSPATARLSREACRLRAATSPATARSTQCPAETSPCQTPTTAAVCSLTSQRPRLIDPPIPAKISGDARKTGKIETATIRCGGRSSRIGMARIFQAHSTTVTSWTRRPLPPHAMERFATSIT